MESMHIWWLQATEHLHFQVLQFDCISSQWVEFVRRCQESMCCGLQRCFAKEQLWGWRSETRDNCGSQNLNMMDWCHVCWCDEDKTHPLLEIHEDSRRSLEGRCLYDWMVAQTLWDQLTAIAVLWCQVLKWPTLMATLSIEAPILALAWLRRFNDWP